MHICMHARTHTHMHTLATLVLDYACACTTKVAIQLARSEQMSLLFLLTHVTCYKESKCARCVASTIIKIYPSQLHTQKDLANVTISSMLELWCP